MLGTGIIYICWYLRACSQHFTEYSVQTGQVGSQHYPYNIGTLGNLLVPTGSQHFTEWSVKFRIHHLKTFYCPLLLFQAPLFRLPVLWPRVQRDEQQSDEGLEWLPNLFCASAVLVGGINSWKLTRGASGWTRRLVAVSAKSVPNSRGLHLPFHFLSCIYFASSCAVFSQALRSQQQLLNERDPKAITSMNRMHPTKK